ITFLSGQLDLHIHSEHWAGILSTLAATGEKSLPELGLSQWPQLTSRQRGLLLDTLMRRPHWTTRLLEGVKSGDLSPAEFDVTRRMQLLNHPDNSLKDMAATLFNPVASPGRAEVIARYGSALNRSGDPAKGRQIYQRACA